jgi:hypothetical protein
MSTANASGDISEGKALSYDSVVKQFGALNTRLDETMSIIKEVNTKLEQQETNRRKAALLAQKIAARRASLKHEENQADVMNAKKREEEEAKRKKLEELKSRLSEVKTKVEEGKRVREASGGANIATGKGAVGATSEEKSPYDALFGQTNEMPAEFEEILRASRKFQELGLLSG